MSENLSGHKLLIVSDTAVRKQEGKTFAYEPVLREVEKLVELFDEIIWLGCNVKNDNTILSEVQNQKIRVVVMPSVRHQYLNTFSVLLAYPVFIYYLLKYLPAVGYVHSRSPSHPAWLSILFSKFDNRRIYWHKYAGNWIADRLPYTYQQQRNMLRGINKANVKVTVNGRQQHDDKHILSFENPCMTEAERIIAKTISNNKDFTGALKLLFVGELNEKKGILQLLDAVATTRLPSLFSDLYIAGNGPLVNTVKANATDNRNITVHVLGSISREQLNIYYQQCHILILPSASEGFPKVIAEAAAFGCIPVITDISLISQYIHHGENGFLLPNNKTETIFDTLLELPAKELKKISENVTCICTKFTYEYFTGRLKADIFNG